MFGTPRLDDQSNLLDSYSHHHDQDHHNKDISEESNEDQFLNRVQGMLGNSDNNHNMTKEQILLQAQIIELQMKCNTLLSTNQKLMNKLSQTKSDDASTDQILQNPKGDESSYVRDIDEMQNWFGQIENIIGNYREQLENYQNLINQQKSKYDTEVARLRIQISLKSRKIQQLQVQVKKQRNDINSLTRKNQELILQIQQLGEQRYRTLNQSFNKLDNSYDKQFQQQMQNIIEKLAEQLEYQKNMKKKMNEEIKRISKQLQKEERTIQNKNQIIYDLQLKLIDSGKMHKKLDNSWGFSVNNKIKKERSYPNLQYFNGSTKIDTQRQRQRSNGKRYSINSNNGSKTTIADLQDTGIASPQILLCIVLRILELYSQTQKKHLNRIKMTKNNLEVQNINTNNISSISVHLQGNNEQFNIIRTPEEYFWNTFDIVENLVITLSLDSKKNLKKSMQQLSYDFRNKKKMSNFTNLMRSIKQELKYDI